MSTHRLGRGTVNVSANLLREEREALGRIATKTDMSISRLIRQAVVAAITKRDPVTGRGLAKIRSRRRQELLNQTSQLELSL